VAVNTAVSKARKGTSGAESPEKSPVQTAAPSPSEADLNDLLLQLIDESYLKDDPADIAIHDDVGDIRCA